MPDVGGRRIRQYTADFETTADPEDCRVWAFAICALDDVEDVIYGSTIDEFMACINGLAPCKLFFHNLAFDVTFIFNWLLHHDYEFVDDRHPAEGEFTALISDMNQVYSCEICLDAGLVTIWDSLKLIPLSVADEAKAFGLPESKGEIDYTAPRGPGYVMNEQEADYIRRDVEIDARSINIMHEGGLDKMTIGACALADYRHMVGNSRRFRKVYPLLTPEEDAEIRKAYRGGWVYANPKYAGVEVGAGISYDVNSLYPSVMASCDNELLPYGKPVPFVGRPKPDELYQLWVCRIRMEFRIKPGHLPCIQLKGNLSFLPTEYITDSDGEQVVTITSVDWELIRRQYDVHVTEWIGGYYFKSSRTLFRGYVSKWIEEKNQATEEGNKGRRQIAKLMLNSLYGKFATTIRVMGRKPVLDEHDVLRYVDLTPEERDGVYLPVGCFITAWARFKTITTAQRLGDRFLYSDTDSVKVLGEERPQMKVDDIRLGWWKDEGHFTRFKALRAKTYMAEYPDPKYGEEGHPSPFKNEIHVAGMPKRCHSQVTFENFEIGAKYWGKLYRRNVPGGVVLYEGMFEIRG